MPLRFTETAGGTNAGTNAGTDSPIAVTARWVPRIPSFRGAHGPLLASIKRPVTGRQRYAPPASGRRPQGAGWGHQAAHEPERRPQPSPEPRGWGQEWRHVSVPRARPGGRFR
jgi:hypothetical protein